MTSSSLGKPNVGLCLQCQFLGADKQSCTKDCLFLVDKRACVDFKPSE